MSKLNTDIYISSEISKSILNCIILGKKINFKKFKLEHLKNKIYKLKNDYLKILKN